MKNAVPSESFLVCPICGMRIKKNFSNIFRHSEPGKKEIVMCYHHIQDALKNEGIRVTRYFEKSESLIKFCYSPQNEKKVLNALKSVKIPIEKDGIKKFL